MNKTTRILSALLLVTLLCTCFAVVPASADTKAVQATVLAGNLVVNSAMADEDEDALPDNWAFDTTSGDASVTLVKAGDEGYNAPADWTGNYVKIFSGTSGTHGSYNRGVSQSVKGLNPGTLYKLSALYESESNQITWDLSLLYFANDSAKGTAIESSGLTLTYNQFITANAWTVSNFAANENGGEGEYVFRMPTLAEGSVLPEGASLGISVKVRAAASNVTVTLANIQLTGTDDLIVNGDFEGDLAGWSANKTGAAATSVAESEKANGNTYAKIQDDNAKAFLLQSVPVDGGKTYRIRFSFSASASSTPRLGVLNGASGKYYCHFNAGTNVSNNDPATTAWHQYTYYFTTLSTETKINIRLATWNTGGNTLHFDDISLVEMTRPADMALYSTTSGAVLSDMPTAGEAVQCRAMVKTTEAKDTAKLIFVVYKLEDGKKQIAYITYGDDTAIAQSKHHYTDVATNFVEVSKTFTIPSDLDSDSTYITQAFVWETLGGLKPLDTSFALQSAPVAN